MRQCKLDDCNRPHVAKGYCGTHYHRVLRTGSTEASKRGPKIQPVKSCLVDDCGLPRKSYGYCPKHSSRYVRTGDPLTNLSDTKVYKNPECAEPGCTHRAYRRGYCRPHAHEHFPRGPRKPLEYGEKDNPYIAIYQPDHPNSRKDGYVAGHIKVMTELLGRALYLGENVHHKNGVRRDNTPTNLELWVTSQPAGQRPEDLVAWARVILERYDRELRDT